jgi:hypothetical protein
MQPKPAATLFRRAVVALALALSAGAAGAQIANSRDDLDISARTAVYIVGLSLLGGLVSWIQRVRAGLIPPWSLLSLVGELCTSAFSGFLCYLLCDTAGLSVKLTMCLVGVAGHMGTRAIKAFETMAERKWGALYGGGNSPDGKA